MAALLDIVTVLLEDQENRQEGVDERQHERLLVCGLACPTELGQDVFERKELSYHDEKLPYASQHVR
ncbi:MAG: hypothetical protein JO183_03465 [Ktedonobacteraceae bacterium]|nr:hypothetical protein [Ktedonobacteraceae bacterium]